MAVLLLIGHLLYFVIVDNRRMTRTQENHRYTKNLLNSEAKLQAERAKLLQKE